MPFKTTLDAYADQPAQLIRAAWARDGAHVVGDPDGIRRLQQELADVSRRLNMPVRTRTIDRTLLAHTLQVYPKENAAR